MSKPPTPQDILDALKAVADADPDHPLNQEIDEAALDGEVEDEAHICPVCAGPVYPLGSLGRVEHFRCRHCGLDLSRNRAN